MRLFRSVLLLMLFASAVPTAVLGWLLASTSRAQLATDALELAGERVERLRLLAAGQLADVRRAVEEAAREAPWSGLDTAERRSELAGLLQRRDEVTVVTLYDRAGRKIPGMQAFPISVAPSEIAEHELATAPLLAAGLPAKGGGPRWSQVYAAPRRGETAMTLVVPLGDPAVGALAAEISLATLQRLVARTRVGARGAAFVVDASGRYVAHPDVARVLTRAHAGEGSIVAEVARALAAPAEMQGARVAEFHGGGGEDLLGAYAVLPDVGWGAVAAQPKADAFAAVERMRRTALAGGMLSLVVAVILGAWFARGIARPVSELVKGALEIARGRFGREVEVKVRNEIGDLAYTFNHMSRELKSYDGENRRLIAALEAGYLDTIRSLAAAIDAKDPYTRGHTERVAELAVEIGRELRARRRDPPRARVRRPPPRRRQDRHPRAGAAQAGAARRGRRSMLMRDAPGDRRRDRPRRGVPPRRRARPSATTTSAGTATGYPDGLAGRGDPARRPHRQRGRHLGRLHLRAGPTSRPWASRRWSGSWRGCAARRSTPTVHDALIAVLNRWTGGAMAERTA